MDITNTLAERGGRYGDFSDNATVMVATLRAWNVLPPSHPKYSDLVIAGLIMDAAKKCRIVNGDPNYADNWHDVQGFAKLVEDRLPGSKQPGEVSTFYSGTTTFTPIPAQRETPEALPDDNADV